MSQKLEKKRGWKRLLSFMLALAMVFTLLPMGNMMVYAMGITVNVVKDNNNISLDVEPSDTVEGVKTKLAEQTQISVENQILKFDDIELDNNNNTIADYNIQKGATLTLESKSSSNPGEAEYDIKYSEIRKNGSGKAYPVGTRIYMDIKPKAGTDDEEADNFFIDSLETAVSYGYIRVDETIDVNVANTYFTPLSIQKGEVITLEESYDNNTYKIKSGGFWIFNLNQEFGDEFYGVVASAANSTIKIPTSELDIVGSSKVGSGTETDPYIISSSAELKNMINSSVDTSGKYYKLSDDFDNTTVLTEPLDGKDYVFAGTFDGNGKTVNVDIKSDASEVGLFSVNKGQISNVNVAGTISGSWSVGGICGKNLENGQISNCTNSAAVTGTKYVGGVCGYNQGSITECSNSGSITAETAYAGGIAGKNGTSVKDAPVENCANSGNVICSSYKDYTGYNDSNMAYSESNGSYKVIGKVGNTWHQIHYEDHDVLYTQTNNDNILVSLKPELISDGSILKFTITIKNIASEKVDGAKVAIFGDTELSGCDRSVNKTNANKTIMDMSYNDVTFFAFSKDSNFKIVNTSLDKMQEKGSFIDVSQVDEKCDSAYSAQWNIDSIAGDETLTRTFYMGCTEGENLSDVDLNKIVNAAVHTHDWKYSVNGNKVEIYCAAEGCTSGTSETKKSALTLNATDVRYSGQAYEGAVVVDNISSLTGQTARVTYVGCDGTTYAESETAPTDAGSYMVKVDVGGAVLTAPFEILPEEMTDVTFDFDYEQFEYNGAEQSPSITVKSGNKTLEKDVDYTVTGDTRETSIGEYSITITGKGNYKGTVTKTWKITKKLINPDLIHSTNNSVTYDGQAHSATVSVNGLEDATITYCESENGTYKPEAPEYTSVGTHKVYYRIEKEGYETAAGNFDLTIREGTPSHDIRMTAGEYGSVSASRTDAGYGAEVTLTVAPESGYRFKEWKVIKGENVTITNNRFVMPDGEVEIQAVFELIPSSSGGSTGGSGSTPSESKPGSKEDYKVPIRNEDTVQVDVAITDGKAEVSDITKDALNFVISNPNKESKVDTITIDLSGAKQTVTSVSLSKTTIATLSDAVSNEKNGIDSATIELTNATVTLDAKTLQTLDEQAKGSQIELVVEDTKQSNLNAEQKEALEEHQVATTFEAYFVSDGTRIHDFNGGSAVVAVRFAPEAGRDARYYHVVYVAEDGKLTYYKTRCKNGKIEFTTTHFSDYAIVYDDSEKNDTDADNSGKDETVTVDTSYAALALRVTKSTKTSNVLKWTKYAGADGYVVYGNKCNTGSQKYKFAKIETVKGDKTTYTSRKLAKGTYYKYCVKAYKLVDGKKVWLATSKVVHATTSGSKYGNAKAVSVNKTSFTLPLGKSATIKAKQIKEKNPIKYHTDIKFESSDKSVATVSKTGVIKAKKKGTAYIYVYAQNGIYTKVKVTVK